MNEWLRTDAQEAEAQNFLLENFAILMLSSQGDVHSLLLAALSKRDDGTELREFEPASPAESTARAETQVPELVSASVLEPVAVKAQPSGAAFLKTFGGVSFRKIKEFQREKLFLIQPNVRDEISYSYGDIALGFMAKVTMDDVYRVIKQVEDIVGEGNWVKIPKPQDRQFNESDLEAFLAHGVYQQLNVEEKTQLLLCLNQNDRLPVSIRRAINKMALRLSY